MSELDAIKRKIMSLAAKTVANGCSEQEAMAAMQGVGRLLLQYNLTMEECDVRTSPCKTIFLDIGRMKRHPIDGCVNGLAKLVDAKCWFNRTWNQHYRKTGTSYAFFGQVQDLELLEYLFKVIHMAMETETENFKQNRSQDLRVEVAANAALELHKEFDDLHVRLKKRMPGLRRSATVSFQHGMAARIHARLIELKEQNDEMLARSRQTGRALVVLKMQLVEDEFRKRGPKLSRYRYNRSISDGSAYSLGQKAGDKVNLSRPLKKDSGPSGLLE